VLDLIDKATLNGVNNHLEGYRAFVSITSRLVCVKGGDGGIANASPDL
jgi:hypothetical protein